MEPTLADQFAAAEAVAVAQTEFRRMMPVPVGPWSCKHCGMMIAKDLHSGLYYHLTHSTEFSDQWCDFLGLYLAEPGAPTIKLHRWLSETEATIHARRNDD